MRIRLHRKIRVSCIIMAASVLFWLVFFFFFRDALNTVLYNYRVFSVLTQDIEKTIRDFFFFVLANFLGGFAVWFFSKREKNFIPIVVALGGVLGVFLGHLIANLIAFIFWNIFKRTALPGYFLVQGIGYCIFVISYFFGIRIASSFERATPRSIQKRIVLGFFGVLLFSIPILCTIKWSDFPAQGSLAFRHAWAIEKFGNYYSQAAEKVRRSRVIQEDIGKISSLGPARHAANNVIYGFSDQETTFTFEVVGSQGTGVCQFYGLVPFPIVNPIIPYEEITWRYGGQKKTLVEGEKKSYSHRAEFQTAGSFTHSEEKLKKLFKEKRYALVVKEYEKILNIPGALRGVQEIDLILAMSYEHLGYKQWAAHYYGKIGFSKLAYDAQGARQYFRKAAILDSENEEIREILQRIELPFQEKK